MPLFDQEKMVKLISELRKSISRLNHLASLSAGEFLGDPDKIASGKYHFIVAIESCIDMCNHIIARNGYRVPDDYGDTFQVMYEIGAFEPSFSEELRNMAKFRNRLVHLYWEVDDKHVYELLQNRTGDFKKFLNAISRFLEWPSIEE
jgi:uncharacterized protein YutE (UPF0331/DUF86 family)